MTTLFINLLTLGIFSSSILTITTKNPVISVIFLISTFVQAAGYLILSGVTFIGLSYIVIYVGAIAVLFLFVIMMINIRLSDVSETGTQYTKNLPLAIAIGSVFIFILFSFVKFNATSLSSISIVELTNSISGLINTISAGSDRITLGLSDGLIVNSDLLISPFTQIEGLGFVLYTTDAVLLISLSMILLLAMLAIIVITSSNKS
uniref:NADH dehydrogenase subunit 6 n=1 Tax=Cyathus jiayuguanensis TaxID=380660 RepID=UPI0023F496BA|nr:NADH dehydrogenase subunit 6 [Cyathus jiayuguanensis]WDS46462.1 NADH dehydrogenase subunit 6 [Cyathus jiayuguanensis]